jgi:hypothetical protein
MKKITFVICTVMSCLSFILNAQTYSTGLITLTTNPEPYSVQIDVTNDLVTLTMIGSANRWLGLGFGTDNMISGEDVVIFDGTTLTDRVFGFPGQPAGQFAQGITPTLDSREDWTVVSNEVVGSTRTLVATRLPDTGNTGDYVFSAAASSLQLVWAKSNFEDFVLQYHGAANRGATVASLTLSANSFQDQKFSISPNPAKNRLNITLPTGMANAKVSVFNVLGKMVYSGEISNLNGSINITNWNSGVYLVKVSSNDITQTKRFIKQ